MSTIVTINASDQISSSRANINTNFTNLNSDKIETSVLDTDSALAANSDTKIPSQKAVKTYIDTSGGANASETARGIVEEATDAEVTAGTATGATGAKLFVTPAKLATRLSASVPGKVDIDTTEITVGNTTVETTLFDATIAANTLGTNGALKFVALISNFGMTNANGLILRLKYGATTVSTLTLNNDAGAPGGTASNASGIIHGYLVADGATNAQKGALFVTVGDELMTASAASVSGTVGVKASSGTAAENSTGALTLTLSADWTSADASSTITVEFWVLEKLL